MKVSKKEIKKVLEKLIHPEISYSLLKLGMIENIKVNGSEISLNLKLPFLKVPIKQDLIDLIEESIKKLDKDLNIKIKIIEMNQEERERFMNMAREGWKF